MRKYTFILLAVLLSGAVNAQGMHSGSKSRGSAGDLSTMMYLQNVVQSKGVLAENDQSIDGTLYLFPVWEGTNQIYVTEEKGYNVETLNYNLVSKGLEAKIAKDSVYQFTPDKIAFVKRNNKRYRYFNINNSNELFLVIHTSKKSTLLKGFDLELTKSITSPMTQETLSKAKYSVKDKFFCKLNDSEFIQFEPKKKDVLNLFKEKSDQIKKYVTDNKLGYSTENDLYKIFKFYDSL